MPEDRPACALLIIDMLKDFIEPDGALFIGSAGREIIAPIKARLEGARKRCEPVLYVCDRHRPDDAEFEVWGPHCVEGTRGGEVVDELAPRPGEPVIPKRRFSGFNGTDLDLTLRELGIRTLTVTGCCTNICVLYTAADARMLDYVVEVPRDCVATFDPDSNRFALNELEKTLGARLL